MYPIPFAPYPVYPPQPVDPRYPGALLSQIFNPPPNYPSILWLQHQETIRTLQYYFSYRNVLQDSYLQSRMNRALWVPLEEIHKFSKMIHIDVTLTQLQEFAAQHMAALTSNFELDKTGTLIRPLWAKMSMINVSLTFSTRIDRRRRLAKAKFAIKKALKSVAKSEQLSHENERVRILILGQERDQTVSAYFSVPGIPSLIKEFMDGYSETGWTVKVKGVKDSIVLSK